MQTSVRYPGVTFITGHDETIRYWDTMNGTLLRTIKGVPGSGQHHTSTIYTIVVGPGSMTPAAATA